MSENQENNPGQMPNMDAVGLHLRRARQARKLEIDEIAKQLRLNEEIIIALEDDDLEKLPAPIYTRGYIRSYAAKVAIDSNKLIETYDKMIGEQSLRELPVLPSMKQYKLTDNRVLVITVIIAVVLVSLFIVSRMEKPELEMLAEDEPVVGEMSDEVPSAKEGTVSAEKIISSVQNEIVNDAETGNSDEVVQTNQPEIGSHSAVAQDHTVTATVAGSTLVPAKTLSEEAQAKTTEPVVEGEDKLELAFTENCWTEVHDNNGKRLLFLMARKGKKYTLIGKAPFLVLLGNSPGVNVSINGEAFDQSAYNRGKVARFYVKG